MGNNQARTPNTADAGESGGGGGVVSSTSFRSSMKSRRGSRVKVFGLLSQKKPSSKEPTTPTTPSSATSTPAAAPPQFGVANVANTSTSSCIEIIDEDRAALHHSHDAVIRQLEFEQMEIRNKKQQKKETTKFCANSNISTTTTEEPRRRRTSTDKLPLMSKKRMAPQPPGAAVVTHRITSEVAALDTTNLSKTTTPVPLIDDNKQTEEQKRDEVNAGHYDHREFIERLIDSTITLENIEFNINERYEDAQRECNDKKPVFEKNTIQRAETDETVGATTQRRSITTQESESTNDSCATLPHAAATTGNAITVKATTPVERSHQNTGSDEPSHQLEECPRNRSHIVTVERNERIFKESFCDHRRHQDDIDDVFNKHMATSLRMSGVSRRHSLYTLNDNCDIVMLRDLSSSSDSLFTDPQSPQSASITAPVGSPAEPCTTATDNEDADEDDDDNDNDNDHFDVATAKRYQTHKKSSYTAVQLPTTLTELSATCNASGARGQRPLSEISIASGDTSGILSPTTAKAILELRKRHQADKLSLLSVAKTSYLEIVPTELPPESSPESTDEQMAMHLGKKLAQVLSGGGGGSGATGVNANANVGGSGAGTPSSPLPDNGNCSNSTPTLTSPATNELFNIAKAKRIELPSLSSRLVATAPSLDNHTSNATASTDAKHLPTLQSSSTPSLSSLHSSTTAAAATAAAASTETQSTVIISFKSSQTPVHSQPLSGGATAPLAPTEGDPSPVPNVLTLLNNNNNINNNGENAASCLSNSLIGATSQIGSPLHPGTPRNNVLKKVASFTVEKASAGSATKINNGDGASVVAGQSDGNGLRRSSFVPEKLSFAAYEKFEAPNDLENFINFMMTPQLKRATAPRDCLNEKPNSWGTSVVDGNGNADDAGNKARSSNGSGDILSLPATKRQMLMKWFVSSLQNNCSHMSEQDISVLTLQYCNNLVNVGVLKQISERRDDLDNFSPFHMYQWTHTEAPTTSQPHTPGKLDKVSVWPYCSTPFGAVRPTRGVLVDSPQPERDNSFQQILRKRLLSCSTIAEVHAVVNDLLSVGEPLRRPSKRCIQLTDLLNASETTVYQYDKNSTEESSGIESVGVQEAAVQTDEVSQAMQEFVCCKCRNSDNTKIQVETCEKETQISLTFGDAECFGRDKKPVVPSPPPTRGLAPPPPPPPPPHPFPPTSTFAPPPPPPPPPPQSLLSLPPPPPPPPMGLGPPPPPPPAPPCDSSVMPSSLNLNTSVVPPPGAPKPPTASTPAPLPNPTEGGWFHQTSTLRKTAVNPPKPMKPLYWTRIVTQPPPPVPPKPLPTVPSDETDSSPTSSPDDAPTSKANMPKEIWQEIDETNLDNIDEFTELFSREAVVPVSKAKVKKEVRVRCTKVLDSKRSQNVGIISRSSHVDFCEIEHAIYHVDTSVVSLETLQQIMNIKATNEELELIKEAAQGDIPLDYPEQFLLKISQISMSTERISCIVFMAEFEEAATAIERKLEVVLQLSQYLVESEELKLVFAIILTLGNYMNGGNRQRGQADGFTLEILSKLKDVKSKESQTTLLHFIVRTYIGRKRKEGVQLLEIPLPIPEPSDVERANQVDFDEVKRQISELNRQLKSSKNTTEKVISNSTPENLEPFKSKVEEFIKEATKTVEKLYRDLDDCRDTFIETMKFYHYAPKTGTLESCTPTNFFEHWTNFTNDFKDIMKKEIAVLWNELLKKSKDVQSRKTVKPTKAKPGGLKERIMRLNKK